jgi:allantoate deiminase
MRLQERLEAIYAIGGGPGANRPAYSSEEETAHALVAGWMEDAGLAVSRDAAGNLFGVLRGSGPGLGAVWTGSHLDSVPQGGRFDGPLGVLAGLEAVQRLGQQPRTLAVVAFRDEEGWRFGRGCFGSRALCGQLEPGELDTVDADGVRLRSLVDVGDGGWLDAPVAYVEAHVEQGPVLDRLEAPLGVVTSIVGLARLGVTFHGRAGHAGTTPMAGRDDALVAAAAFVGAVRTAAERLAAPGGAVATVGRLAVQPGAANVIPERVELVVDARAPDDAVLVELLDAIVAAAGDAEVELLRRTAPVPMAEVVQEAIRGGLADLGLPAPQLHSGAGHDAGVLGAAGVPSGMLFVRSRRGGVSHSPAEHSEPEDVDRCVDALAGALRRLAGAG